MTGYDVVPVALHLAVEAHQGQTDKTGMPYIFHPLAVAHAVHTNGPVHFSVALLHDVIEDTNVTLAELAAAGLPAEVVDAVEAITHRPSEPRSAYYERVKANPVALVVKLADIAHNTSPSRLDALDPDTAERLRAKYAAALEILDPSEEQRDHHHA